MYRAKDVMPLRRWILAVQKEENTMQSSSMLFTAKTIMTTDVVSVGPETDIANAADMMERHRVSGLPVVDHQQRVLGVITEYDLLQSITNLQMSGKVADFMTTNVTVVDQDTPLIALASLFTTTRVRRVPVTCDGRLVGVVSRRDLIFAGNIRQQLLTELPTRPFGTEGAE